MTIDELKRLDAAATPGPWAWEAEDGSSLMLGKAEDVAAWEVLACPRCKSCQEREGEDALCRWPNKANGDLILAARNALPALLAVAEAAKRMEAAYAEYATADLHIAARDVSDALAALEATK